MYRNEKDCLCNLLDCGIDDLEIIKDCKYNIRELAERAYYETGKPVSVGDICKQIFRRGLIALHNIEHERYIELKNKHDPHAHCVWKLWSFLDIAFEIHCQRPYIYFVKNEDDWRAFFNDEIERVEGEMGFKIEHSDEFIRGQEALEEEQREAMIDVLGCHV